MAAIRTQADINAEAEAHARMQLNDYNNNNVWRPGDPQPKFNEFATNGYNQPEFNEFAANGYNQQPEVNAGINAEINAQENNLGFGMFDANQTEAEGDDQKHEIKNVRVTEPSASQPNRSNRLNRPNEPNQPNISSDVINQSKELARDLIHKYFTTVMYPYTKHHIDSYDAFLKQDLMGIIKANNPILILKDVIDKSKNLYKYKVKIWVGGIDSTEIEIGTPTLTLQNTDEIRLLYPNEARLRNLSYASTVYANIVVQIEYTDMFLVEVPPTAKQQERKTELRTIDLSPPATTFLRRPLFIMPIMLHSSYCVLHNKPKQFLKQVGECPYDNGGYFIIDGSEKVLITRQEQAFNTLYITSQTPQKDAKVKIFANIQCLSTESGQVKRIAFAVMRSRKNVMLNMLHHETIQVSLPFVRKPVPLFIVFRALGFQSDEEIIRLIFPDFDSSEARLLLPKLHPSIIEGHPFLTSYTAASYIKTLTKGFSIAHVLDIIHNKMFIHMPNDAMSQALFLGECVRKILRVSEGYDNNTDRDDTRNQRCLTSGFLIQELFNNSYKQWIKAICLAIGKEYNYNKAILYQGANFKNIFSPTNETIIFLPDLLRDMIMKGFKGKWGTGLGEDKQGVLQAMSRLSYTDFMSHCRRVIMDFDTSLAITGPRKLHTTQYGYFCTSETPTGGSIGITKNLSIMAAISTSTKFAQLVEWLQHTGDVYKPADITIDERIALIPVYINGGLFGYTEKPYELRDVLKLFKRTGCLPYSVSIVFSFRDRAIYIYMDAGRPLRPLIWLKSGNQPVKEKFAEQYEKLKYPRWRDLVFGTLKMREHADLNSTEFVDPLEGKNATLAQYIEALEPVAGAIEYIDPYEQNETFIANYSYDLQQETTHIEVHPSTIMSMMTSMIPFAPHNQSPRNQLSCSQSKQGVSIYATNWRNRFDNTAHVLCYGEMPLVRTIYNNYLGEGNMVYGMNCILAIACWSGYNQEDGIVMNYDAVKRGMFRTINYRSYQAFEEDDKKAETRVRFGNPIQIGEWKDLRPGLDYSKLDNNGIIREGEYVDENTVIVGAYMMSLQDNKIRDASTTPQVWTRGRVEKVVIMYNNMGLRLVKIRVVQDRIPELGDKFSNRHGQKGTIGALLRGYDMPRTQSGIVPDMIMNPHAIPSRMTIAQNLEQLLGKAGLQAGSFGDGTSFMNTESPQEEIGDILEARGFEKYGNEVMYNGATGEQITASIFIGPVYGMRLKHMVEDKWQARGKGRKEVRTHQPTAGRGSQGGLKIGEMDRDAILGHATAAFFKESFMERSDGVKMPICISCGTVPIFNPKMGIVMCAMCDGPVQYMGDTVNNMELLPALGRPKSRIVEVEIPFATKLLAQEQETFLNMSMRFITTRGVEMLKPYEHLYPIKEGEDENEEKELQGLVLPEVKVAHYEPASELNTYTDEQLKSMQESFNEVLEAKKDEKNPEDDMLEEAEQGEQPAININIMQAPVLGQMSQMPQMQGMQQMQGNVVQAPVQGMNVQPQMQMQMPQMPQIQMPQMQPQPNGLPQPNIVQPQMPQMSQMPQMPQMQPQAGGMQKVVSILPASVPGGNPIIAVDTSMAAMEQDGIDMMGGRPLRRRFGGMQGMQGMQGMPQMQNSPSPSGSMGLLTITKLE